MIRLRKATARQDGTMSGANYWAEREAAKRAALKMAANLSARDKGLAVSATTKGLIDDVRHDQTYQRAFERSFLSLDHPDENGNMWDYGDCGRDMRRTLRAIDAPFWEHVKELRFRHALYRLRDCPELQKTLRAIRRHRVRRKIFSALKIGAETYEKRFRRVREILEITT